MYVYSDNGRVSIKLLVYGCCIDSLSIFNSEALRLVLWWNRLLIYFFLCSYILSFGIPLSSTWKWTFQGFWIFKYMHIYKYIYIHTCIISNREILLIVQHRRLGEDSFVNRESGIPRDFDGATWSRVCTRRTGGGSGRGDDFGKRRLRHWLMWVTLVTKLQMRETTQLVACTLRRRNWAERCA